MSGALAKFLQLNEVSRRNGQPMVIKNLVGNVRIVEGYELLLLAAITVDFGSSRYGVRYMRKLAPKCLWQEVETNFFEVPEQETSTTSTTESSPTSTMERHQLMRKFAKRHRHLCQRLTSKIEREKWLKHCIQFRERSVILDSLFTVKDKLLRALGRI